MVLNCEIRVGKYSYHFQFVDGKISNLECSYKEGDSTHINLCTQTIPLLQRMLDDCETLYTLWRVSEKSEESN